MHTSDCAVHNMPAYPAGECNCGHALKVQRRYGPYVYRLFCNQVWRTGNCLRSAIWKLCLKPSAASSQAHQIALRRVSGSNGERHDQDD